MSLGALEASLPDNSQTRPPYRAFGTYRLTLAILVVLGHSAWLAPDNSIAELMVSSRAARVAVFAFFILSGFIMSEAATTFYRNRPAAFGANRILRIVPPYLAALAFSILVHAGLAAQGQLLAGMSFEGYEQIPKDIWSGGNILANLLAVFPFSDALFDTVWPSDGYVFVRYIWAIQVELLFYSVVWFAIRRASTIRKFDEAAPLLIVLCLSVVYVFGRGTSELDRYFAYTPYFVFGVLLWRLNRNFAVTDVVGAILALALMMVHEPQAGAPGWILLAVLIAILVRLISARSAPAWQRWDRRLGDLSYAVYLNHFAVLVLFSALVPDEQRSTGHWAVCVLIVLVVSALLEALIEGPLGEIRSRIRGHTLDERARASPSTTSS